MDRNVTKYWFVRALRLDIFFLAMLVLALAETPAQASTMYHHTHFDSPAFHYRYS